LRADKRSDMGILQNFKTGMQQRALRRILAQQSSASRGAMHYDHARQLSILFNASELKEREFVLRFAEKLTQNGKKVSLLGFFDHAVESSDFVFPSFTEADFDWMLRPKSEPVNTFLQQPSDLLIHANTRPGMYELFVVASAKAKVRVGPYAEHTECYELMADTSGNTDIAYYLKQVEFLLQKTNTKP